MTKRLLDKRIVKISFNESSDEQDFNNSWDLNFSSDEDIFLKGKSEILWSRTRDLFGSTDSFHSFSDFSGRTVSSCSWNNDDFDMKSSRKVQASLEAIDNALYEKVGSPLLSDTVFQECCDWAEKFPYFRIKAKRIIPSGSDAILPHSTSSAHIKHFDAVNSKPSLLLEGKKLSIHSTNKSKEMCSDISVNKVLPKFEEIINEDEYEEYFAVHKSDQYSDSIQVPINDNSKLHSALKLLQDKITDKIVSEMWPNVVAVLEKIECKNHYSMNDDLQLPPISVDNDQKRILSLKRPKTEGSSVIITEFPKLESILTVSPKILQKRELSSNMRVTRPNSEMSVHSHVPSNSVKSIYHHSKSVQVNSENPFLKSCGVDKESETLLALPTLEEDFHDSSNVLRGFHIEPGRKDLYNKAVQSSQNEYDFSSTSRENDYFLPPIEDKNYVSPNMKLTKNLFTFYGSPKVQDKNPGSARYKKSNSRPNTSVSKKMIIKNQETTHQVPVTSGLYITARGVNKATSNVYTDRNSDVSLIGNETVEESQVKPVTLFPIVTSLTPLEDKNNSSVKKGLLQTFLGGKKR